MPISKKGVLWIVVFCILFLGGIAGGFFYFSRNSGFRQLVEIAPHEVKQEEDASFMKVYYPFDGRLVMEERKVRRQVAITAIAEEIINEFLKGPSSTARSAVPPGAKLLSVYYASDGILYVDVSDEFRRNFQGDALNEFLLLKGLYDSIITNVTGVQDVKVIVEGKEIESIGGHFLALYPLKNMLAAEVK
jgi:spore germination protein GerM